MFRDFLWSLVKLFELVPFWIILWIDRITVSLVNSNRKVYNSIKGKSAGLDPKFNYHCKVEHFILYGLKTKRMSWKIFKLKFF